MALSGSEMSDQNGKRNCKPPEGYEMKFSGFIGMIEKSRKEGVPTVLVAFPWVLGDTYEEIIESLSRLAEAGLALQIAGRGDASTRR